MDRTLNTPGTEDSSIQRQHQETYPAHVQRSMRVSSVLDRDGPAPGPSRSRSTHQGHRTKKKGIFRVSYRRNQGPRTREEIRDAIRDYPHSHGPYRSQAHPMDSRLHAGPVCPPPGVYTHQPAPDHRSVGHYPPWPSLHWQCRVAPACPVGPGPSTWWDGNTAPQPIPNMPPPLAHTGDYVRSVAQQRGLACPPSAVGGVPARTHHESDGDYILTVRGRQHNIYGAIGTPVPKRV